MMEQILSIQVIPTTPDLPGLLKTLEEGAIAHADQWDCGFDQMRERYNCAWMVARTWIRLTAPLTAGQPLELRTWTRPIARGFSRREFDLLQDGRLMAEAVQAWMLADLKTRRIRSLSTIPEMLAAPSRAEGKDVQLHRPIPPKDLQLLGTCVVKPEDIDRNGHLNNARYPRYALSVVPGRQPQQMLLSYSRECFAGDEIAIWGKVDADSAILQGRVNDTDSFDLAVHFFPESNEPSAPSSPVF